MFTCVYTYLYTCVYVYVCVCIVKYNACLYKAFNMILPPCTPTTLARKYQRLFLITNSYMIY